MLVQDEVRTILGHAEAVLSPLLDHVAQSVQFLLGPVAYDDLPGGLPHSPQGRVTHRPHVVAVRVEHGDGGGHLQQLGDVYIMECER